MGLRRAGLCLALACLACLGASARTADELWGDAARFEAEQSDDLALRCYRRLLHDFPDDPRTPEAGLGELRLQLATMRQSIREAAVEGTWRRYCEQYRGTSYEARACAAVVNGSPFYRLRLDVINRFVTVLQALPRPVSAAERESRAQLCLIAGKAVGDWRRDAWAEVSWCLRTAANLAVDDETKAAARHELAVQLSTQWRGRGEQTPPKRPRSPGGGRSRGNSTARVVADFPRTQAAGAALLYLAERVRTRPAEAARMLGREWRAGSTETAATAEPTSKT